MEHKKFWIIEQIVSILSSCYTLQSIMVQHLLVPPDGCQIKLELALTGTDCSGISTNVHWNVPRTVNSLFTGRTEILTKIQEALHHSHKTPSIEQQKRFVITGLGGQGKSEICLKIADLVRQQCVKL
jgi:hypothetical protein